MNAFSRRPVLRQTSGAASTLIFTLLAAFGAFSPAAAQTEGSLADRRDPVLATAIAAAVPGGGHYYAGEPTRAAIVATTITAGAALVWSAWRAEDRCVAPACEASGARARSNVGIGLVAGAYLFGLVDAPLAVRRQNRARALPPGFPTAHLVLAPDGAAGLSLRIPFTH